MRSGKRCGRPGAHRVHQRAVPAPGGDPRRAGRGLVRGARPGPDARPGRQRPRRLAGAGRAGPARHRDPGAVRRGRRVPRRSGRRAGRDGPRPVRRPVLQHRGAGRPDPARRPRRRPGRHRAAGRDLRRGPDRHARGDRGWRPVGRGGRHAPGCAGCVRLGADRQQDVRARRGHRGRDPGRRPARPRASACSRCPARRRDWRGCRCRPWTRPASRPGSTSPPPQAA